MARLAAAVIGAVAALASGWRLRSPGAAAGVGAHPWALSAPLAPELLRADVPKLVVDDDDAHHRVAWHFAEVLGLHRDGRDDAVDTQPEIWRRLAEMPALDGDVADVDDEGYQVSRHLAAMLRLRGGDEAPSASQGDGIDAPSPGLEDVASSRGVEDRLSLMFQQLHARIPAVGGAAGGVLALMEKIRPLMRHSDVPLRVMLMSWAVYDDVRRTLKLVVPKPFLDDCEEFFRVVAGVELKALETVKRLLKSTEHLAPLDVEVRQAHAAAIKYLADEMRRGVQPDHSLSHWQAFVALAHEGKHKEAAIYDMANRMEDYSEQYPFTHFVAMGRLSREAAVAAARIDVTSELIPADVRAKTRITLLGLIAALGDDAVFQKVQAALGDHSRNPPMSIKVFKRKMGVNGFLDLLKKLIHKYTTPNSALRAYLALYTVGPLRDDPVLFQIIWCIGLASRAMVSRARSPAAQTIATYGLFTFFQWEAGYRGLQFLNVLKSLNAGTLPSSWELLLAAHGMLTPLLFMTDLPADLVANLRK